MNTSDQSGLALALTPALPQANPPVLMPGEFAGMYEAGFEAGTKRQGSGISAGLNKEFSTKRDFAGQPAAMPRASEATHDGDKRRHVAVTFFPVEGQPATEDGPLDPRYAQSPRAGASEEDAARHALQAEGRVREH
jgi:hypothetical protein